MRGGTDKDLNASYGLDLGATRFELNGFYVRTDRTKHERSREYNDQTAENGPIAGGGNLLTDTDQFEDIALRDYVCIYLARH